MAAEFWDRRARKYNDAIERHDAVYLQTIRSTKSLLSSSDVVLDLGCATGEYSLDISPSVRHVHGVDTSTSMIAMAMKKASDRSAGNVSFCPTDLFDQSLDARGCTAVLAFSILHLVEDIHTVLGRVNALLPTGGLLISETPCFGERGLLFRVFLAFAQKMKIAPPVHLLTVPELEAAIANAGFAIAESRDWDPQNAVHWIVARKT